MRPDDQDQHGVEVVTHLRAWLQVTVFHINPAISMYMSPERLKLSWERVPFVSESSVQNCFATIIGSIDSTLFFLQLFGLFRNAMTCPNCGDGCTLRERRLGKKTIPFVWRCQRRQADGSCCTTELSMATDSYFGRNNPMQVLSIILNHLSGVRQVNITSLGDASRSTTTKTVRNLQHLMTDLLSVVEKKLSGKVNMDAMYLHSMKKSRGRVMGNTTRTTVGTVMMAQQVGSARFTGLVSTRHENADAAEMLAASIEPGLSTTLLTDFKDSPFSPWVRAAKYLGCEHEACNHSEAMVDPETKVHINNVERRNGIVRKELSVRGGGRRTDEVLQNNLAEFMWKAWYSPRGKNAARNDILMTLFSIWTCFGFEHTRVETRKLRLIQVKQYHNVERDLSSYMWSCVERRRTRAAQVSRGYPHVVIGGHDTKPNCMSVPLLFIRLNAGWFKYCIWCVFSQVTSSWAPVRLVSGHMSKVYTVNHVQYEVFCCV
jgi:hypothetical protein